MSGIKSKKNFYLIVISLSVLLIILPLFGVYIYLKNNSDDLLRNYLKDAERETGLKIQFEDLDVIFFPLPALTISNANINSTEGAFTAGWLLIRPNFLELIRGNFAPAKIVLLRPRLQANLPFPLYDPDKKELFGNKFKSDSKSDSFGVKFLPFIRHGCFVEMKQGEIKLTGSQGETANLLGVECKLEANAEEISGTFNFVTLNMRKQNKLIFSIERCELSGMSNLWTPFSDSNINTTFQVRIPGIITHALFAIELEGSETGWDAALNLKGDLDLGKAGVPWGISGRLIGLADSGEIAFRGFSLLLDADSGELNASLIIPSKTRGFELAGTLQLTRLSLTQWLGFARNLMPGLALALDNITDGSLDFILTSSGLIVPRIRACAQGSCFKGTGSVKSFAKPNIVLDLRTTSVNLGDAIPEAIGKFPDPPKYFHATLTPMPGKPAPPGESGIDYDINLSSDKVIYGPLKLTNGKVKITQGKMDKNGLEDVLIYGDGQGYGGTMKGLCILGGAKNLPMAITASARNIDAKNLSKDLPIIPIRSGNLEAEADVKSSGKKLDVFLANLRGNLIASGKKPLLFFDGKTLDLEALSVSSQIRKGIFQQESLGLDAKWQTSLDGPGIDSKIDLNGLLWFGGRAKSVTFQNVPGKIDLKLSEKLSSIKGGLNADLSANCTARSNQLELKNINAAILGLKITGNVDLDYGKNQSWKGNLKTNTDNLPQILHKFSDKSVHIPENLRHCSIESQFSGKPNLLTLSQIKGQLGPVAITGKFTIDSAKKIPVYNFDLQANKIDLTQFENKEKTVHKNKKWDLSWLKTFNATGKIQISDLFTYGMRFQKCFMPIALENGKLKAGPGGSVFYGANLHLRANADFNKGINFNSQLEILAFDLGRLAKDHKLKSIITGLASLTANIKGFLTGPGQIPVALDGSWTFKLKNGSWQKIDKQGKPSGKPTPISIAEASGTMNRGIAETNNIYMQNNSLKVRGGGWADLANQKLDCNFNIDMKGLPNFPLRLYGSFDKPQTSIGAGEMVLNAIGGITGGLADIFGSIVQGTLNIFR